MRFLKLVAIVAGLFFAVSLTVLISPLAGFALALPVTAVSGFALFRPLPRLGLGSRVFAGVIFVFVGLGNLAFFQDVAERETYLAALRESDPAAYLDELEETDPRRWLRELEALAPERYRAEIERREREAAEAARRREQERAERAAEKARQEAERAAEEERLAAVQARLREMSERAKHQLLKDAKEVLVMWAPKSVTLNNGTLTVVLPQRRITQDIYTSVLTAGLCMGPALGKDFSGITELVVLNQFARQGYVFERGAQDCDRLNKTPVGSPMLKTLILGATHLY